MVTSGEGYFTDLPKATHIDIAFAMTLWILRHGTSGREYRRRMTLRVEVENTLSPRPLHQSFSGLSRESCAKILLCNNKANLLTWLTTRCKKILCTRHRMTGVRSAGLVPLVSLLLPLSGRGNNLLILSKNSANTFVAAKKVPLIKDIGFAERERDLLFAYFSSFFPHVLVN